MSSGAEVVFNTTVPPGGRAVPGAAPPGGFTKHGGKLMCTYFEENILPLFAAEHVEGLYGCLDYYQDVSDPFSMELLDRYDRLYPGGAKLTGGSAATGMYRGLKLWEAAVKEAGSLRQEDVIKALDHAKIAEGPGGPAQMVPGQHHVRMNIVHRPGQQRQACRRQEPRGDRSEGVRARRRVSAVVLPQRPDHALHGRRNGVCRSSPCGVRRPQVHEATTTSRSKAQQRKVDLATARPRSR